MMQQLLEFDTALFLAFNSLEVPVLIESLFVTITMLNRNLTFLLYAFPLILLYWFYKGGKTAFRCFVALLFVVGTTDYSANQLLKKTFKRRRPHRVKTLETNLRLPYSPKGYSFVSNHSANMFSAATVLSAYYPPLRAVFYVYAALVAFSRPFVGVHYPSDIFFGGLTGFLIASLYLRFLIRKKAWFMLKAEGDNREL
ncbi:MAG: phosphatase PAP2 family protein [Bdellovibrionales bacterium]|nr:phosphatase PAP2 family protein [Bdellovibrionales bacterium]